MIGPSSSRRNGHFESDKEDTEYAADRHVAELVESLKELEFEEDDDYDGSSETDSGKD